MKSATQTHHLCSESTCMHVSYRLHNMRLFVFHLNWFISLYGCIMFVRKVNTEFHVHRPRWQKAHSCLLSLFYKSAMFYCYCEYALINVEFYSKDALLLSVWPEMTEYFRSKWAHRRLHLSCCERYCSASSHRHLNTAHFYRLTLHWVVSC